MSNPRIIDGVFAINKPPSISSAQVVRDLQQAFRSSTLFKPWMDEEKRKRDYESNRQKNRRRDKRLNIKIGHGGTLDPLATGVLVIGVGRGTKYLQNYTTGSTKSYSTTLLFGAATDTYDVLGKVLSRAPYEHVTREKVEEVLDSFRGRIMQTPPIYSALNMDGKRLYEYARDGKELPREIAQREATVEKLEIEEWLEPGSHDFMWPHEQAPSKEKRIVEKVLHLNEVDSASTETRAETASGTKRKRDDFTGDDLQRVERPAKRPAEGNERIMSGALPTKESAAEVAVGTKSQQDGERSKVDDLEKLDPGPPAVKLDMTVTSGFYVRSACHDIGNAVGSHGLMASLVRTRQGEYALNKDTLEYDDLGKGEELWGPKVKAMLEAWQERTNPPLDAKSAHPNSSSPGQQR